MHLIIKKRPNFRSFLCLLIANYIIISKKIKIISNFLANLLNKHEGGGMIIE